MNFIELKEYTENQTRLEANSVQTEQESVREFAEEPGDWNKRDKSGTFGQLFAKDVELLCEKMVYQMRMETKKSRSGWVDLYADQVYGISQTMDNLPFFSALRLNLPTYLHAAANRKDFLRFGRNLLAEHGTLSVYTSGKEKHCHEITTETQLNALAEQYFWDASSAQSVVYLHPVHRDLYHFKVQCNISNACEVRSCSKSFLPTTNILEQLSGKINRNYLPSIQESNYDVQIQKICQDMFVMGYEGEFIITSAITKDFLLYPIVRLEKCV